MPHFIPEEPTDFHDSYGEEVVFQALRHLPDRVYVFHSVNWKSKNKNQGEADFLIFDPEWGILVIEVKSGGVEYNNGTWFYIDKHGRRKARMHDPFDQANRSVYFFVDRINSRFHNQDKCPVHEAVWFPSIELTHEVLPAHAPREITLDYRSLKHADKSIADVFRYWNSHTPIHLTDKNIREVLELIAPSFKLIPIIKLKHDMLERKFKEMTDEQTRILDFLEEQDFCVISGDAGTGKTVIALEKARRLANRQEKVLFLTINALIREHIEKEYHHPYIEFYNFEKLAKHYIPEAETLESAIELFLAKLVENSLSWEYKHIIIDEGQDFKDDSLFYLKEKTPGQFYVFYDRNQLLLKNNAKLSEWFANADCKLVLTKNCRNTYQIAHTAHIFIGNAKPRLKETVEGRPPVIYEYNDENVGKHITSLLKEKLRVEKLDPEDITVLTFEKMQDCSIEQLNHVDSVKVSKEYEPGSILKSTIRKYKGLESNVVILTDVELSMVEEMRWRRKMYTASSRAKLELFIYLKVESEDTIEKAVRYFQSSIKGIDENLPPDRRTLAEILGVEWVKLK